MSECESERERKRVRVSERVSECESEREREREREREKVERMCGFYGTVSVKVGQGSLGFFLHCVLIKIPMPGAANITVNASRTSGFITVRSL